MPLEALRAMAGDLGFSMLGVTTPLPEDRERMRESRVLVLGFPYRDAPPVHWPQVHISTYYLQEHRSYHLAARLSKEAEPLGLRLTPHVSGNAKSYAKRAGMARHGRNGLLHAQGVGTRFTLQLLGVEEPLPLTGELPVRQALFGGCAGCDACVRACPAGALDGEGNLDVKRCLRAWMGGGEVCPVELRPLMGNHLRGCETCQRVCLDNRGLVERSPEALQPYSSLADWMTPETGRFSGRCRALGEVLGPNLNRPLRMRRQLALIAGNHGDPGYLPTLRAWAQMRDEILAEHATWAIQRIMKEETL